MSTTLWSKGKDVSLPLTFDRLNSSLPFDHFMVREDLKGSIAHVRMLGRQGIIDKGDALKIEAELKSMLSLLESSFSYDEDVVNSKELTSEVKALLDSLFDESNEDIHTAIEKELICRLGECGKKLHTARSRNDQVATTFRLFVSQKLKVIQKDLKELITALCDLAEKHTATLMPGYTHLQHAMAVSLGFYLSSYASMFLADADSIKHTDSDSVMKYCPLGSLAFCGTTFNTDRFSEAEELGFKAPSPNASYGVSDRDFLLDSLNDFSKIGLHLSRLSEELILWSSSEFGFVTLSPLYSTGSSIMPQKRNADSLELIRSKSALLTSLYNQMSMVLKSLPLAYNKDLQEDKEIFIRAFGTVHLILQVMSGVLMTIVINCNKMLIATKEGYMNAIDAADNLVRKGVPFRESYDIVGLLVNKAIELGKPLEDLPLSQFKEFSPLFDEDIYSAIDLLSCMERRSSYGATSSDAVNNFLDQIIPRISGDI